jgi:hypothetical protein
MQAGGWRCTGKIRRYVGTGPVSVEHSEYFSFTGVAERNDHWQTAEKASNCVILSKAKDLLFVCFQ